MSLASVPLHAAMDSIYMFRVVGPPTTLSTDICNAHPVGTWGVPPHHDVWPYVTRFQLPHC